MKKEIDPNTTPILDEVIDGMMLVMKTNLGIPFYTQFRARSENDFKENRRLIAQEL